MRDTPCLPRRRMAIGSTPAFTKSRVSEKQMGADIPLAQQHPERPGHLDVLKHVAEVYGVNVNDAATIEKHIRFPFFSCAVFVI